MKKLMCLMGVLACVALGADEKKAAGKPDDLCTAPPASTRPSFPAKLLAGQGVSHLPITTKSAEAQKFFDQGLAQMHSFSSYESERSFMQAAQLDPAAPMPQWGIAMVAAGDYRPAFQLADRGTGVPKDPKPSPAMLRAREAARQAQELSGYATPLEKAYIAAIVARRNTETKDADGDYVRGLREVVRQFPQETEAKSFLALALMSGYTTPDKKPRAGTEESVALLAEILQQDPNHVGAHHYVIHGYEGSEHPEKAWVSCKRYPELAPEIPHALHMPGHIYVQSNRWQDAAKSFEDAAAKEYAMLQADQLYPNGHHGHNVHFLIRTYDALERYDDAVARSQHLMGFRETPREKAQATNARTVYRQGWFALMRTLVHFREWDEILDGKTLPEYPAPREEAWRSWARGLAYVAKGDTGLARAEAKKMDEQMKAWRKITGADNPQLAVARVELAGHIDVKRGKVSKGFETLERAGEREIALPYNEPPAYPRPAWEAMGQAALEAREWARAEKAFRRALEQNPGSPRATEGLAAAGRKSTTVVASR